MIESKTKGQIEAEVSEAMVKFEKEHMGRGPDESKTYIIDDMILVRLKGVLTPAERKLATNQEGIQLIKQMRARLLENSRKLLTDLVNEITGVEVMSMHTDISTKTGERIIVFNLKKNIEKKLKKA